MAKNIQQSHPLIVIYGTLSADIYDYVVLTAMFIYIQEPTSP